MSHLHEYPISVEWSGGRDGAGSVTATRSNTKNSISVPPEFQGPGNGTNPEELLASAIAACFTITFGIVAANQKLPVIDVKTEAVGIVEQSGASFVYKQVVIRPTIRLEAGAGDDMVTKAEDFAHRADKYCIITNAVRNSVEIVVEPTILRG